MRVVTWNLAYMKPSRHKTPANRRRQWALLAALAPDVALLQECRPADLAALAPSWMAQEYTIVGAARPGGTACAAVLARTEHALVAVDGHELGDTSARWLEFLAGYVAPARLVVEGVPINVASVHALAGEVDHPAITAEDHEALRRPCASRAYFNDVAAGALTPLTEDARFVIGGDWNVAALFDTTYPATAPASSQFFAGRQAGGWHHALRKFEPDEVRTYVEPSSAPYELDHLFTDAELHDALVACHVVRDAGFDGLSDHVPVVAEFITRGAGV
ncbi:hypothetical protein GXB85_08485 [Cellulomonas sp. APG4]|uniref:endonuclease/exonuclease/phosphatase family protein n=1 Tax=Cellulomonas sp. APG4 TaxID=1538656 RepID=UPI001379F18E|nr:endonuclease/exonuclease/phosphatase family protein [Cellulomonas sp. APG4]NCT90981.1 hypothetical protein [Cellulomonas sp. APG4]